MFSRYLFLLSKLNLFLSTIGVGLGTSDWLSLGSTDYVFALRFELIISLVPSLLPLNKLGLDPSEVFTSAWGGYSER
jgi:hypothetical protein